MIYMYGINRGAYKDRIIMVPNGLRILMALREHPELDRQSVLFPYIGNTRSNGTGLVKTLEVAGLMLNTRKGRILTMGLTDDGKKVADAALSLYRLLRDQERKTG